MFVYMFNLIKLMITGLADATQTKTECGSIGREAEEVM